jgi:hypothetical protein
MLWVMLLEHIMDPGSHVGFQISTKNTNLVEDHPVNISGHLSIAYVLLDS